MNDRLGDLPSWADEADEDDAASEAFEDEPGKQKGDVEMAQPVSTQPKHMEHFFREVESIKQDIEAVSRAVVAIEDINEEAIEVITSEEEAKLSKKLRPLVDSTNMRAKRTKTMLGLLKEETKKLQDEDQIKQSDLRIRENLCNTLTRKFIDEMKEYQNAQQKYKNDLKKKMQRQVKVVKPDATDEEIENVIRQEGGRDALYRQQILTGAVNDEIKTTYEKVAGKYQDCLAIEQSVAELHQMFLDFALLTEQQGELLDKIDFQVNQAADYTEDANVELYEAGEIQKSIRKKQMYIMMIVMAAILVLLFAIGILP